MQLAALTTVRALLRADSLGDWRSILRIAHPDALREFRESEVRALSSTQDDSVLMRDISQCVKEKIELANKLQLDSVYHVASATELGALPPDTVFARYRRWQARVQNVSPPDTDSSLPRRRYLGHLSPDDSTAYGIILESWDRPPMPDWPAPTATDHGSARRRGVANHVGCGFSPGRQSGSDV